MCGRAKKASASRTTSSSSDPAAAAAGVVARGIGRRRSRATAARLVARGDRRDRAAWPLAALSGARSLEQCVRHASRHRAGRASVQRTSPVGRRAHELRLLPPGGPRVERRARQGTRNGRARSPDTVAVEHWLPPLVRLGWSRRLALGPKHPPFGRPARDGRRTGANCRIVARRCRACVRLRKSLRQPARWRRRAVAGGHCQGAGGLPGDSGQPSHAFR